MKLTVCVNKYCSDFEKSILGIKNIFKDLNIEVFNESFYNEKKKAFKVKGGYSARMIPFALLTNDKKYVKAFYSEDQGCTIDAIINFLKQYFNESSSN